jgi:hypothetical protein
MAKGLTKWTVFPHGPIERPTPRLLTVTGGMKMPLTVIERRMTVVLLARGRLLVHSAIALEESQMRELEALGTPAFLVVPSGLHRNDAFIWKARYPNMTVVAPSGARARVEEVVPVDTSTPDFGDDAVRFVEVAGMANQESALEVRDDDGVTLVLNDVVGNLPPSDGLVLRAFGFATAEPRVPRIVKRLLVKDVPALRRQLEQWADQPVVRIFVSHGRPILTDAAKVLRDIARAL